MNKTTIAILALLLAGCAHAAERKVEPPPLRISPTQARAMVMLDDLRARERASADLVIVVGRDPGWRRGDLARPR